MAFLCCIARILVGLAVLPFAVVALIVYHAVYQLHDLGSRSIMFVSRFVNAK